MKIAKSRAVPAVKVKFGCSFYFEAAHEKFAASSELQNRPTYLPERFSIVC